MGIRAQPGVEAHVDMATSSSSCPSSQASLRCDVVAALGRDFLGTRPSNTPSPSLLVCRGMGRVAERKKKHKCKE